jgi:ABC-type cobalamin/Fe3+-siderophores transport system ATPase subunit
VRLARALVQQPDVLLLNDRRATSMSPTSSTPQIRGDLRLTTVAALHDVNLAAMFCDEFAVITAGRIIAAGPGRRAHRRAHRRRLRRGMPRHGAPRHRTPLITVIPRRGS